MTNKINRERDPTPEDTSDSELLLFPIMSEPKNPLWEHLSCLQINDVH